MTDSTTPDNQGDMLILSPEVVKRPSLAKELAYGASKGQSTATDNAFRVERGQPFLRAGTLIFATPQFKGQTIYSPTGANQQISTSVPSGSASGVTSGPTTGSATYAVITDMKLSVTTSGGKLLSIFSTSISSDNGGGDNIAKFNIFRDGVQIGKDFQTFFANPNLAQMVSFQFLDSPPVGVHTYDIRWKNGLGTSVLTATGTTRFLQAIELQLGSSPGAAIAIPTKAR